MRRLTVVSEGVFKIKIEMDEERKKARENQTKKIIDTQNEFEQQRLTLLITITRIGLLPLPIRICEGISLVRSIKDAAKE